MISAVVLAAGLSTRMGSPKMLLPWADETVIGKVVSSLQKAGIEDILVISGGLHKQLQELLKETGVQVVFNKDFANGEMLTSVQVGIKALSEYTDAILIVLGDQPQVEITMVQHLITRYQVTRHPIIVPSYQKHRGHPWLLANSYWDEILALTPPSTLRDFLNQQNEQIDYLEVDTPSVIQDLDTPQDYTQSKP